MNALRNLATAGTFFALAATGGNAFASFSGTVGGWSTASPTTVSIAGNPDIIFTFLANGDSGGGAWNGSSNLDGTSAFADDVNLQIGYTQGQYVFDLSFVNTSFTAPLGTTYGIQYYIDVDGWFSDDQPFRLEDIFAGLNVTQNDQFVFTKRVEGVLSDPLDPDQSPSQPGAIGAADEWTLLGTVFDETLTTSNNAPDSVTCGSCTRFLITDTLVRTVAGGGIVSSATNSFTIAEVPEPATLALFGTGLFAAGVANRRRRRNQA